MGLLYVFYFFAEAFYFLICFKLMCNSLLEKIIIAALKSLSDNYNTCYLGVDIYYFHFEISQFLLSDFQLKLDTFMRLQVLFEPVLTLFSFDSGSAREGGSRVPINTKEWEFQLPTWSLLTLQQGWPHACWVKVQTLHSAFSYSTPAGGEAVPHYCWVRIKVQTPLGSPLTQEK